MRNTFRNQKFEFNSFDIYPHERFDTLLEVFKNKKINNIKIFFREPQY